MQYRKSQPQRVWWFPAVALAVVVALTWAPLVAAGVTAIDSGNTADARPFTPGVAAPDSAEKFAAADAQTADVLTPALPKRAAPRPKPAVKASPAASRAAVQNGGSSVAQRSSGISRSTAAAPRPKPASSVTPKTASKPAAKKPAASTNSSGNELAQARSILASLIAQHPALAGTTVSIGSTPGGYQAVAYFKSGRILISTNHKASLSTILRHEIWHVLDWRDNGRIDWGENVPPK